MNEFKIKKGLIVQGSGSTILDIQGSQGQLFSVTDSLSGSLFSVNDISGIPIVEVFSNDTVNLGTFGAEAIIVEGSTVKFPNLATGSVETNIVVLDGSGNAVTRSNLSLQGVQGTQGTQGIQGRQGITGTQGTQGTQGIQGRQGITGTQGTTGASVQGIQGITGTQGTQGTQGIQGRQGITGTQGTQGIQGRQGITGTQGTNATTSITNNVDNYVVTATGGATPFNGEASLRFNGSELNLTGSLIASQSSNLLNTIQTTDGTKTSPAYSFISDVDTGMYRDGTNILGLTAGGQPRVTLSDTNLFLIPGSTTLGTHLLMSDNVNYTTRLISTSSITVGAAANVAITTQDTTPVTFNLTFTSATSGNGSLNVDATTLTYAPNTGIFSTPIVNSITGIRGGNGSAGTPAFSFSGDNNNGMYRITTDTLGFSTAGTARMRIDSSGNVGIGEPTIQGRFHVFQTTNLGGTAGNSLILQSLQNTGGTGGNNVYIKDYAVRDATGTTWTTWRHHNSIDIDGAHNTPGTNTKTWWERDPLAGIHYFGDSATTALTVNGTSNTIVANNIEIQAGGVGIFNDGGDLAIGDFNGSGFGTTLYGQNGNNLINLSTNFTQFYFPITYTIPQGTSEVNGEVVYFGGGSVVSGSLYYYNSSGNWAATDADAASTATGMLAIARATGTASTVGMLLRGRARFTVNSNYTALTTVGAPLYISTTPGAFSQTAPTGTGDIVRIIGYVQSTGNDEIYFCPDNTWVELA